jgi:hypothetical protein
MMVGSSITISINSTEFVGDQFNTPFFCTRKYARALQREKKIYVYTCFMGTISRAMSASAHA